MYCSRNPRNDPSVTRAVTKVAYLGQTIFRLTGLVHAPMLEHQECFTLFFVIHLFFVLILRRTIVNRTYGLHKILYIYLLFLTIFGPIHHDPP